MKFYHDKNKKLLETIEDNEDNPLETLKVAMEKWYSSRKDTRNL